MKRMSLLAIILSIFSINLYALDAKDWQLSPDGIGPIKIDMTLKQAQAASGIAFNTKKTDADQEDSCYMLTLKNIKNLSFMISGDKIVRINVNSLPFATDLGAKVGDTEQQVLMLYHNKLLVEPHRYEEQGHYLTLSDKARDRSIRFESDGKKITRIYAGKDNEIHFAEDCS